MLQVGFLKTQELGGFGSKEETLVSVTHEVDLITVDKNSELSNKFEIVLPSSDTIAELRNVSLAELDFLQMRSDLDKVRNEREDGSESKSLAEQCNESKLGDQLHVVEELIGWRVLHVEILQCLELSSLVLNRVRWSRSWQYNWLKALIFSFKIVGDLNILI